MYTYIYIDHVITNCTNIMVNMIVIRHHHHQNIQVPIMRNTKVVRMNVTTVVNTIRTHPHIQLHIQVSQEPNTFLNYLNETEKLHVLMKEKKKITYIYNQVIVINNLR